MEESTPLKQRISSFYIQCRRVWQLLRKPTGKEFKTIASISALGILAIGAVGFIVSDLIKFIGKFF